MRILLSTESLRPPLTGIGRYTANLLSGLMDHPFVDSLTCFSGVKVLRPEEALRASRQVETSAVGGAAHRTATPSFSYRLRSFARRIPGAYRVRAALAERTLRGRLMRERGAVYHEPNFILREFDGPSVATIHDLSFVHFPDFHPRERVEFMMRGLPSTLQRANRILTVSEFVRQEIISTFGVAQDRIHAVPLGVDQSFMPRRAEQLAPVLAGFGLEPQRYVLSVATFEPRKNLEQLVRAYLRIDPRLRQHHPLVLAGAPGWRSDALDRLLTRLEREGSLYRIGYVDEKRLPYLYAGASLFAFVSIYEGFGLPLLEAMACGVPVVASRTSSMPEVVGDVGLAVDPMDADSIVEALERGLDDAVWRQGASVRGIQQAAGFRWDRCVDETVKVYRLAGTD